MEVRADDRGVTLGCPSCGQANRLLHEHLDKSARCGKCRSVLPLPGSPVTVASSAAFDALVQRSPLPVVVDYWAPWCAPCRAVAPELEKLAASRQGRWVVAKVNTDELQELGARDRILSIPTLAVFAGGREVGRTSGARPAAAIEEFVEGALHDRKA